MQNMTNDQQRPSHSYGAVPTSNDAVSSSSARSTSLFTYGSDDSEQSAAFLFIPLVRTLSEGAETLQLLKHPSFALKDAVILEDDRIESLPAAGIATIPSEVANMTKNLIGGGVLSLSSGLAMYANDPRAWKSALFWVLLLGAVFGYFCLLIGKSCQMSKSSTYRECWERTVGHRGGLFVAIVNTLDPLLGIFSNASILSQSMQLLLQGFFDIHLTVVESLLLITFFALLPLCLMKNLDALAPFSAMGMAAVLAALACMMVRYFDGSYMGPDGKFYNDIPHHLRPSFGTESHPFSVDALPFLCMVYTSFDMHYNSPRFYAELKDTSVPRFGQVVTYSFGITSAIYFAIALVGFLTFGEHCDGYILNNYSANDSLASISRVAIGLCSLVSYPLNFIGVRDNCLDMLGLNDDIDSRDSPIRQNVFTILLLSFLTLVSCFVTDLGLISSVGGGTTVTVLCFVFPAIMFREGLKKFRLDSSDKEKWEVWLVVVLTAVGVILGLVGVWISIATAYA
jgi:sodium-coupled neutral amino acid transporter 11